MLWSALNAPVFPADDQWDGDRQLHRNRVHRLSGTGYYDHHRVDPTGNNDWLFSNLAHAGDCKCTQMQRDCYDAAVSGSKFKDIAKKNGVSNARVSQVVMRVIQCKARSWKINAMINDTVAARYLIDVLQGIERAAKTKDNT